MEYISVGDYLLLRLHELGISDILGVPGDFNLDLVEQIERDARFKWISECNELNASYAADGYARIHGISALVTTYGPGELSAVNGIAGAYSEHIPVIKITGAPALAKQNHGLALHHTLLNEVYDQSYKIYQQVTVAAERLDFIEPDKQIDRLIETCSQQKRPVYLQIPQDVLQHKIAPPHGALRLTSSVSVDEHYEKIVAALEAKLCNAQRPIILVGELVGRYNLVSPVEKFLRQSGYLYVVSWGAKGIVSEQLENYCGMYAGVFSLDAVREFVEQSDCVVSLGWLQCEITTGTFSTHLSFAQLWEINAANVIMDGTRHDNLNFSEVVRALTSVALKYSGELPSYSPHYVNNHLKLQYSTIEHDNLIVRLSQFLQPQDTLILETGTIGFTCGYYVLPDNVNIVASINWFSIGYALGATSGIALAKKGQGRTILVVGDGSLQMSAQAISTQLRYGLNPLIVVLNNSGYTIERIFLGEHSAYNDIQGWNYRQLPAAFGGDSYTATVSNDAELLSELIKSRDYSDRLCLIEVMMDKFKQPPALQKLAKIVAAKRD